MRIANITFKKTITHRQVYNSFDIDSNYMVSTISFNLDVDGNSYTDMEVEVRQPYGCNYMEEPLEVARMTGEYKGDWSFNDFGNLCDEYYRICIGSEASGIHFGKQATVIITDNTILITPPVLRTITIPETGG